MGLLDVIGDSIRDEEQLDELLSEPSAGVVDIFSRLDGDIVVLGVAGKMGPTLARMARRASDLAGSRRRVIGVARFSEPSRAEWLWEHGVETHSCDLLDIDQVYRLPNVPYVVFMAGMKFGASDRPSLTWAMNCLVPASIARRYRDSRIVAFSTGNVYGVTTPESGGSKETDELAPRGDYAMSCVGRERILDYSSRTNHTLMTIIRLNYANEMRYGVLVDLAQNVRDGHPIDLGMGYLNAIWQGDANAAALRAFEHVASPPRVLNIAGPEVLSVRYLAEGFGQLLGKAPIFTGEEAPDALLSNASEAMSVFGYPRVDVQRMMRWIADWVARGGPSLHKPTHFEVRTGKF